jgi:hypothetical protein
MLTGTFQVYGSVTVTAIGGPSRGNQIQTIRDASGKQVQEVPGLRAPSKQYIDRYNVHTDWTFAVAWDINQKLVPSTPMAWLQAHNAALMGQGVFTLNEDGVLTYVPYATIFGRKTGMLGVATIIVEYHLRGGTATGTDPGNPATVKAS